VFKQALHGNTCDINKTLTQRGEGGGKRKREQKGAPQVSVLSNVLSRKVRILPTQRDRVLERGYRAGNKVSGPIENHQGQALQNDVKTRKGQYTANKDYPCGGKKNPQPACYLRGKKKGGPPSASEENVKSQLGGLKIKPEAGNGGANGGRGREQRRGGLSPYNGD